ncbi:MAG: N-6 DNA methylase [Sneathiellaceae bacterium]
MSALDQIAMAAHRAGYRAEAVVRDYAFADVLAEGNDTRTVPLVAFTRTPPSYRSAAFGVVESDGRSSIELVQSHRALGAPLLFVIDRNDVTVWQVRSEGPPRALEKIKVDQLTDLFERNEPDWHPDAIHRAKAVGSPAAGHQLDFVDLGLLPAIEGEIHLKLERLLVETLALARKAPGGSRLDVRTMFRVVFRLLAAKVLKDRRHPFSAEWNTDDLASILTAIERYYSLSQIDGRTNPVLTRMFSAAWAHLRAGISFSNISADVLAFVYENTLVTPEARKLLGTHSTPRQVAEYIVQRLELHRYDPTDLQIYEPCAGAGVFLVSALRHLRDLLPVGWSDQERHNFLIEHIAGDEIDPFACEVATLSLILADYPNHNGWHIREADLLVDGALAKALVGKNVIVCNPPFEAFTQEEKERYPEASRKPTKAVAVLCAVIDAQPLAIGFILPRSFILEKQFAEQRRRIEELYGFVEIVELPDRIFGASSVESAALIARDLRSKGSTRVTIRSAEVADRDRVEFLKTGRTTVQRETTRDAAQSEGKLWIPSLQDLWTYLAEAPRLGTIFKPRWGLRWNYEQDLAASDVEKEAFRRGYLNARRFQQYAGVRATWLDFNLENLREGYDQDWSKPKLIMNATRLSRGPWRVGAIADLESHLYSQQFFGLWPLIDMPPESLLAFSAVMNGPVVNAYLAVHSPRDRFRSNVVAQAPMPTSIPKELPKLVQDYLGILTKGRLFDEGGADPAYLLAAIDATVLRGYDLPLRQERQLLSFFRDAERPVPHQWAHWDDLFPVRGLTLAERISGRFHASGDWVRKIFRALPDEEITLLRDYVA